MELGCDPFIASKDGKNAFLWAARIGAASVLKIIAENLTSLQVRTLLDTESKDGLKLKPIQMAARFDHMEAFACILDLEFFTETSANKDTFEKEKEDGEVPSDSKRMLTDESISRICKAILSDPASEQPEDLPVVNNSRTDNVFKPDENGDTLLHLIVRHSSTNVYRFFAGVLVRINK